LRRTSKIVGAAVGVVVGVVVGKAGSLKSELDLSEVGTRLAEKFGSRTQVLRVWRKLMTIS
jgi:hypothetical protein